MSPLHRSIAAEAPRSVLHVHLAAEVPIVEDAPLLAASGRNARTIVKHGPLRMTLIAVSAGGHIPAHRVDAPVSVHVLRGALELRAGERTYEAAAGELLVLAPGMEHDVSSREGALFLLTVIECQPTVGEAVAPQRNADASGRGDELSPCAPNVASPTEDDVGIAADSAGLGYTSHHGEIWVHYPTRAVSRESGSRGRHGPGWPIGPIPAAYASDPLNAITAERMRLWTVLRSGVSALR